MTQILDWTARFNFGGPRSTSNINNIIIHVTVNAAGTPCENVANYQISSQSGSYHELVDANARVLIENTDDWVTWSTGNKGNFIGLHRSFVMRGTESRAEWLKYDAMLRAGARRDAEWAKKYGIPIVKLSPQDLLAGKKGFCGHVDTQAWGGTDHVDPGAGFPWDYYLQLVREYAGQAPQPQGGFMQRELEITRDQINKYTGDYVKGFNGPIGLDVKDIREQICGEGSRNHKQYTGWDIENIYRALLGRRGRGTLVEIAVGAYIEARQARRIGQANEKRLERIASKVGADISDIKVGA